MGNLQVNDEDRRISLHARVASLKQNQQSQFEHESKVLELLLALSSEPQGDFAQTLYEIQFELGKGRSLAQVFRSAPESAQAKIRQMVKPEELNKLFSLAENSSSEMFWEELLHWGVSLKNDHQWERANLALQWLASRQEAPKIASRSLREWQALAGQGSAGMRCEVLLSRFSEDTTDARTIAPMIGATVLGSFASAKALQGLLDARAGILTRGLGAELLAGMGGFIPEFVGYAAMNRALAKRSEGDFSSDLARSFLSLGALKFCGFLSGMALSPVASAAEGAQLSRLAQAGRLIFPQASLFTGMLAAHRLEEYFSLRTHQDDATTFTDVFSSMISLGVGAHLGKKVLGERFELMRLEMLARAKDGGSDFHGPTDASRETFPGTPQLAWAGGPSLEYSPGEGIREARAKWKNIILSIGDASKGGQSGDAPGKVSGRPPARSSGGKISAPQVLPIPSSLILLTKILEAESPILARLSKGNLTVQVEGAFKVPESLDRILNALNNVAGKNLAMGKPNAIVVGTELTIVLEAGFHRPKRQVIDIAYTAEGFLLLKKSSETTVANWEPSAPGPRSSLGVDPKDRLTQAVDKFTHSSQAALGTAPDSAASRPLIAEPSVSPGQSPGPGVLFHSLQDSMLETLPILLRRVLRQFKIGEEFPDILVVPSRDSIQKGRGGESTLSAEALNHLTSSVSFFLPREIPVRLQVPSSRLSFIGRFYEGRLLWLRDSESTWEKRLGTMSTRFFHWRPLYQYLVAVSAQAHREGSTSLSCRFESSLTPTQRNDFFNLILKTLNQFEFQLEKVTLTLEDGRSDHSFERTGNLWFYRGLAQGRQISERPTPESSAALAPSQPHAVVPVLGGELDFLKSNLVPKRSKLTALGMNLHAIVQASPQGQALPPILLEEGFVQTQQINEVTGGLGRFLPKDQHFLVLDVGGKGLFEGKRNAADQIVWYRKGKKIWDHVAKRVDDAEATVHSPTEAYMAFRLWTERRGRSDGQTLRLNFFMNEPKMALYNFLTESLGYFGKGLRSNVLELFYEPGISPMVFRKWGKIWSPEDLIPELDPQRKDSESPPSGGAHPSERAEPVQNSDGTFYFSPQEKNFRSFRGEDDLNDYFNYQVKAGVVKGSRILVSLIRKPLEDADLERVRQGFPALAEGQWIRVLDLQTMKAYLMTQTPEGVRTQEEILKMDAE